MPKRYAREFRRAVGARLVVGEKVSSLSKELGVSEATLYLWRRQALIDAGRFECRTAGVVGAGPMRQRHADARRRCRSTTAWRLALR
jgi:transposase-like protein